MRGIGLSIGSPHSSRSGAARLVSYPRIFARHPVKKHSGLMAHAGVFLLELQEDRDLCLDCNCERDVVGNARRVYQEGLMSLTSVPNRGEMYSQSLKRVA